MLHWYFALALALSASAGPRDYMVIDLSGGPRASKYPARYESRPPDVDFDTCRTKELWLRLIPAGTFLMGAPPDQNWRLEQEDLHTVTLTQPFYIGVFQVTQKQYEQVMGTNPSRYKGDTRPVEMVSYDMLRGASAGKQWPATNTVDAASFFGVLRAKTALPADLPTDAQWEYACRAGTITALYSGKNVTDHDCPNVSELARNALNSLAKSDGKGRFAEHTKVGMYKPNDWGLYDMLGNVNELCLDWYVPNLGSAAATDPRGPASSADNTRVIRGGDFEDHAHRCHSAYRYGNSQPHEKNDKNGFRVAIHLDATQAAVPLTTDNLVSADDEQLATTCAEFKAVWDTYKESLEKITAEFQPKLEAVNQQYQKSLEALRNTVQGRGDFEKTKAVVAEIERFSKEKNIPPTPDEKAIAEIKALQTNNARPLATLERDMLSRLNTLTQRYGQALEQLQASLVRAGKLDDAEGVNEALKRAKQSATDLAAQLTARNPTPGGRR